MIYLELSNHCLDIAPIEKETKGKGWQLDLQNTAYWGSTSVGDALPFHD